LPFSSEVAFLVALQSGMLQSHALFFASFGNILAIILNYFLGFWLYEKMKIKLHASKIGKKSYDIGHKYGYISVFLSWIPIVGDPLTIVAGVLRINFFYFFIVAGALRIMRYYFLTIVVQ
jgi:membrane protein YqaA with SNARE-associated domain